MMKTVTCSKHSVQMHVQPYREGEMMMMIKFVAWQWSLRSLETLRPLVAPLLRLGCYSLGPSGL